MMYKEYKLKHFFMCVLVLVIGIVSFIAYASRKNAPAHIVNEEGVDISTPFYATPSTDNYHTKTNSGEGENTKPHSVDGAQDHDHMKEGAADSEGQGEGHEEKRVIEKH